MPSQTAPQPGREERLPAAKSGGPAHRTHPAAANGSREARGPSGRSGELHGAPACASSPKNSTAVTALPMMNQSLICCPLSFRSMMAATRGSAPRTATATSRVRAPPTAPLPFPPAARPRPRHVTQQPGASLRRLR